MKKTFMRVLSDDGCNRNTESRTDGRVQIGREDLRSGGHQPPLAGGKQSDAVSLQGIPIDGERLDVWRFDQAEAQIADRANRFAGHAGQFSIKFGLGHGMGPFHLRVMEAMDNKHVIGGDGARPVSVQNLEAG
jgi:hypothetical protein